MMSETVKRYWLRLDDIGGHEYMVRASEYDTLATRLAEAEAWLDEVATLCVTAERRAAELEAVIEQRNGECVSLHARVAELEAGQESLILVRDDYKRQAGEYRKKWAELEARQGKAVEPAAFIAKSRGGFGLEMCLPDQDDDRATLDWQPLYYAPQPAPEAVAGLVEALKECAASLAWHAHGECRAIHDGPIMPSNMALEAARAALAAYTQAKEVEA